MKMSEELDEALNPMPELSAMAAMGKYAAHFQGDLHDNQTRVGDVENVTRRVQKNWSSMESIFMASKISVHSCLRTRTIWCIVLSLKTSCVRSLARGYRCPQCSSTVGGRAETLTGLLAKLDLCEKSLNNYLAVKKKTSTLLPFEHRCAAGTYQMAIVHQRLCSIGDCFPRLSD